MSARKTFLWAFIAVTSLFFMWGFITVIVDAFIPRLKEVFELSYRQAGLVQVAWFLAYLLLSIPGGYIIERIGYKGGILVGLGMAALGCLIFYPAAGTRVFGLFLLALFVVASGITILQVAANPYISVLGEESGASSRLNLAQAFNSFGTTIAPLVSASFLLSDEILSGEARSKLEAADLEVYLSNEAAAVQTPFLYLAGGFLLLALFIGVVKLPKILGEGAASASYFTVLKDKKLVFGALGIFVYVGAEVALSSYMVNYGLHLGMAEAVKESPALNALAEFASWLKGKDLEAMDRKSIVGVLLALYWGGAMVGRFIGSGLMQKVKPEKILAVNGGIAALLVLVSIVSSGSVAFLALLGVGLFNSIMFPTIFTLGISNLGDAKPLGSGVLCTAIFGGAVIPPTLGALVDGFSWEVALILPILCYAYIAWYASAGFHRSQKAISQSPAH